MQDHLRYAALAAAMTDDELAAAQTAILDPDNPTGEEQAILDELIRRNFGMGSARRLRP